MSDLISRSKVISILQQLNEHSLSGKMDIDNAIYLLENKPTAYSIDKVVEELEKAKIINVDVGFGTIYKTIRKDAVVEIVKHGGVDDDVCECRLFKGHKFLHKTSCRNIFDMQNGFKYCPFCGKKIKVVE